MGPVLTNYFPTCRLGYIRLEKDLKKFNLYPLSSNIGTFESVGTKSDTTLSTKRTFLTSVVCLFVSTLFLS